MEVEEAYLLLRGVTTPSMQNIVVRKRRSWRRGRGEAGKEEDEACLAGRKGS